MIIVPGYGLAVARAQAAVAELARMLTARGIKVCSVVVLPVVGDEGLLELLKCCWR